MTGIDFVAMLALAVVAGYIFVLGRGERGEAFSRMWPVKGAEVPGSEPADEGAAVPGEERRAA